jgi:hypothetical protein
MSGQHELDAMIAKVAGLTDLVRDVAPECAHVVEDVIKAQIAAGTDPYGAAWPAKKDGGKPLAGAGKAVYAAAIGKRVFVRLHGVDARHSIGWARGGVRRQILPDRGIPPKMATALVDTIGDAYKNHMGAR